MLPPVADATAYLHAETSPWPTKGGTACSEVLSQPGAAKLAGGAMHKQLSIPESPEQLKDPRSDFVLCRLAFLYPTLAYCS